MIPAVRLPDPYLPEWPYAAEIRSLSAQLPAAANWPSANRAMYIPVIFPVNATVYNLQFRAGNGTGNYDLGLYDDSLRRIASSGSTAMTAAGTKTLSLGEYRLHGGTVYYAALALSSTSGSTVRVQSGASTQLKMLNMGQEASALPLPTTATPIAPLSNYVPLLAFGVR